MTIRRAAAAIAAAFLLLVVVLVVRTLRVTSRQPAAQNPVSVAIDTTGAVIRFATALTFPTVSYDDPDLTDSAAFWGLHDFLEESYPLIHETLNRELISDLSLLYTWTGRDPGLAPIVLMGHIDVVPISPGTEGDWEQPPFGGVVSNGFLWGRGALDDKSTVMAVLEAVERLLGEGFQPARTIYLAFGHDEEAGGQRGAKAIVDHLTERGVGDYSLVLDEGGAIFPGSFFQGIPGYIGLIGTAEKGVLNLELSTSSSGGHSSTPPSATAIGILSEAIRRLEANPFPAKLDGASAQMLQHLSSEMPFAPRLLFANMWLFRPLIVMGLLADPSTAAMVRTTTAPTIFNAGVKSNVLPIEATATVNFRIRPGETVETVTARARDIIDDERVTVRPSGGLQSDPPPLSSIDTPAFELLSKTLLQVMGEEQVLVTPFLLVGATDARYYRAVSDNVYRFGAFTYEEDAMERFHGTNERLSIEALARAIAYYYVLIRNTDDL